ncbi:MAG TPA: hypothetical protein VMR17_06095 [Xanthobacteraceae bacterium]|nr:hypothetical protein [Xanthobacteraceae bacterium]
MLVVLGIFLAGIITGLNKELSHLGAAILCFIAAGLAVIFARLDRRNRDLVWLGEEILMYLERECIFRTNGKFTDRHGQTRSFGILWRQVLEEKKAKEEFREGWKDKSCVPLFIFLCDAWHGKHRIWFPVVSYLIAAVFVAAGIIILKWPALLMTNP